MRRQANASLFTRLAAFARLLGPFCEQCIDARAKGFGARPGLGADAFWVGSWIIAHFGRAVFRRALLYGREARRFGAQFCRLRWTGEIGTYERRAYAPTGQCEPFSRAAGPRLRASFARFARVYRREGEKILGPDAFCGAR